MKREGTTLDSRAESRKEETVYTTSSISNTTK